MQPPERSRWRVGSQASVGVGLVGAGVLLTLTGLGVVPGILMLVAGSIAVQRAWGNRVVRRHIEDLEVSLAPETVAPGEVLTVTVSFSTDGPVELGEVRVRLLLHDQVEGIDVMKTRERVLSTAQAVGPRSLAAGEVLTCDQQLATPPDAALSSSGCRWLVQVEIDIVGWADIVETHPLTVRA